jgi:hypothetical protein
MTCEEFFKFNHIDTIEKAKTAFILCNCSKYYMWHDYTDKLNEYNSLGVTREQELEWMKEQFFIELKTVKQYRSDRIEWWHIYSHLVEKACSLKENSIFILVLELTTDLINENININHYHILSAIIGTNAAKTHGGFIEYAMKYGYKDIAQKAYCLALDLIKKVYPIITNEQSNCLKWLSDNLEDEINIWPDLNKGK